MIMPDRRRLIFGALAVTLAAAAWMSVQDAPRQAQGRAASARSMQQAAAPAAVGDLRLPLRPAASRSIVDPFARATAAAGSAAHGGAMRAKPVAPPLPFVFLGRYVEGDEVRVFLGDGEGLHMVSAGDIIDKKYRVDRIDNAVRLTYLPLNETQILPIGDME